MIAPAADVIVTSSPPALTNVALEPWLPVVVPLIAIVAAEPDVEMSESSVRWTPFAPALMPVTDTAAALPIVLIAERCAKNPIATTPVPVVVPMIVIEPPSPVVWIAESTRLTPSSVAEVPDTDTAASSVEITT